MIMFTPYIALQVKARQAKQQLANTIKYSQPLKQSKIFTTPNLASSCRSTKSYDNPLNWSSYSFQQKSQTPKKQPSSSTTRSKKYENQQNNDSENKKSYQILIKQSLRRSFTTRKQNKSTQDVRDSHWQENTRRLSQHLISKNKQDILDFLNELEGKRCVMNNNTKGKPSPMQNRSQKSKSLEPKPCAKKQRQLKIQSDEQFRQTIQNEAKNQPVVAIGMAAKRQNLTNTSKNQPNQTSGNKIAISTTQCLIFTQPSPKKSFTTGLYVQSQANFVRAKKKSKVLYKKVANFLRQQEDQQPRLVQSRIFEFKNSITKNLNLEISNSQNLSETMKQIKKYKNPPSKKQQNIKIEGWQTNAGWDLQANF